VNRRRRALRLELGPCVTRLATPGDARLDPLGAPLPGWAPPRRPRAGRAAALSVSLRALARPPAATTLTLQLARRPRATVVLGESPLWRLRFEPVRGRGRVWLPATPAPYREGDGLRSALRTAFTLSLLWRGGATLHGAVVVRDGLGIVALGASGAGKSTFARRFPWDRVLADDLVALTRDRRGAFVAHGTPFRGREGDVGAAGRTRVAVVALLDQAARTRARRLAPAEAVGALLPRVHAPAPLRAVRERALSVALALARTVPCVHLGVSLEEDPWPSLRAASTRR
jgi:hypothetical protein